MAFLFTRDKQHVCGEQKMVLVVLLLDISVNFTDQNFYRLKSQKSGKNVLIFNVLFRST